MPWQLSGIFTLLAPLLEAREKKRQEEIQKIAYKAVIENDPKALIELGMKDPDALQRVITIKNLVDEQDIRNRLEQVLFPPTQTRIDWTKIETPFGNLPTTQSQPSSYLKPPEMPLQPPQEQPSFQLSTPKLQPPEINPDELTNLLSGKFAGKLTAEMPTITEYKPESDWEQIKKLGIYYTAFKSPQHLITLPDDIQLAQLKIIRENEDINRIRKEADAAYYRILNTISEMNRRETLLPWEEEKLAEEIEKLKANTAQAEAMADYYRNLGEYEKAKTIEQNIINKNKERLMNAQILAEEALAKSREAEAGERKARTGEIGARTEQIKTETGMLKEGIAPPSKYPESQKVKNQQALLALRTGKYVYKDPNIGRTIIDITDYDTAVEAVIYYGADPRDPDIQAELEKYKKQELLKPQTTQTQKPSLFQRKRNKNIPLPTETPKTTPKIFEY